MKNLRLIFWDQLSTKLPSFLGASKENDVFFFCENRDDCTHIKHHKKKLVFLISAMRHFAADLEKKGYAVCYFKLKDNKPSYLEGVLNQLDQESFSKIIVTHPGEYRQLKMLEDLTKRIPVEILEDDRFLCSQKEFKDWAAKRKEIRMAFFYQEMRKKYNILMDDEKPIGGEWSYDSENRKPPKNVPPIPKPYMQTPDKMTTEVMKIVESEFSDHFGDIQPFYLAVTRSAALDALKLFIQERLSLFGDYQDAMLQHQPWMYHSHLSFYINIGLLDPMECIKKAEEAYHQQQAPLNAVEGFIRQILGWREYVRGIYWLQMPNYKTLNFLEATRSLPSFYWTGDTSMNCLKQSILETKQNAYAHHIQRLMVLGNFALLTGIHPDEMNEWYWIVYADAHEWVELPNVTGMILFADGGYMGSKPYAAGGAYIHKMSNYCDACVYQVSEKTGEKACPFNYLYWNFLIKNQSKLKSNQRLSMIYSTLNKMAEEKKKEILNSAEKFLLSIETP